MRNLLVKQNSFPLFSLKPFAWISKRSNSVSLWQAITRPSQHQQCGIELLGRNEFSIENKRPASLKITDLSGRFIRKILERQQSIKLNYVNIINILISMSGCCRSRRQSVNEPAAGLAEALKQFRLSDRCEQGEKRNRRLRPIAPESAQASELLLA
jgi:hypothetical protein